MTKQTEKPNSDNDVPTIDFFEGCDLNDANDLSKVLRKFIDAVKSDYFLHWEIIERKEQGLPLNEIQTKIYAEFAKKISGPVFYINELARPSRPWYEIAREITPLLLKDPFVTSATYNEVIFEGWLLLGDILETRANELSLPAGVKFPLDIIPPNLIHRLNIQLCLDELYGLGQKEDITLEDEDQLSRIDEFISVARGYKDSFQYLNLTLEKLLRKVVMSPKDEKIFTDVLISQLGINSLQEKLGKYLDDNNFKTTSFLA